MSICIVDASYYMHRAFFGSKDDPVGGLKAMLSSAIEYHKPDRTIAALDAGRETFRNKIYPAYKGNRPPSPEGYSEIVPAMKAALTDLGCESIAAKGFEADDIIGTLCEKYTSDVLIILSRDKDLMQLVRDGVAMWFDGTWIEEKEVWEKFGVVPERVVDVLALIGDPTDNIPGVAGVGEKTAIKLMQEFGSLDSLYDRINEVTPEKLKVKLAFGKDNAFLSRQLTTINCNVPLP